MEGKEIIMEKNFDEKAIISREKKEKCEKIINASAVACGGVGTGLAQLPLADSAIITPIQIAMVIKIGKELDMDITESMATAIVSSLTGAVLGRSVSAVMFGWLPVVGNIVNAATSTGLTKTIGYLAMKKFKDIIYDNNYADIMCPLRS